MRIRPCYALLFLTALTGCRVGPNHTVPVIDTPEEWSSLEVADAPIAITADYSLVHWWEQFKDPFLNEYMDKTLRKVVSITNM